MASELLQGAGFRMERMNIYAYTQAAIKALVLCSTKSAALSQRVIVSFTGHTVLS